MNYFYAEIANEMKCLYESKFEVKKGDVVVVPPFYEDDELPKIAKVTKVLTEIQALTNPMQPIEIIQKVNMSEYILKLEKERDNRILLSKMKEKVSEIQLIEKMKKYANMDKEMASLFNEYNAQNQKNEVEEI